MHHQQLLPRLHLRRHIARDRLEIYAARPAVLDDNHLATTRHPTNSKCRTTNVVRLSSFVFRQMGCNPGNPSPDVSSNPHMTFIACTALPAAPFIRLSMAARDTTRALSGSRSK